MVQEKQNLLYQGSIISWVRNDEALLTLGDRPNCTVGWLYRMSQFNNLLKLPENVGLVNRKRIVKIIF
jgi:hypothetical protein